MLIPRPLTRTTRLILKPAAADSAEVGEALSEAGMLVELLSERHADLAAALEGQFPELRATVWQSEGSVQAAVQVRGRWQ